MYLLYISDYMNSLHIYRREICVRITLIKGSVCRHITKKNPHRGNTRKFEKFHSEDLPLLLQRVQLI